MRISCIIPTLGRSKVLCETIRMLLMQSPQPHEIVVIDQTKTPDEETRQKLAAWEASGCIRYLHQDEPNASLARNNGALAATGDILLFLDDDIVPSRGFIAAHANNYDDQGTVAVCGQILEGDGKVTETLPAGANNDEVDWTRFPKNYAKRCLTSWMQSTNFSVRREIYFEVGGMDENYKRGAFREETDFAMRFLQAGYRFQFDPAASIVHLGIRAVPRGGARSWRNPFEMHHHVGNWYFNLKYLRWRNALELIWYSGRQLIASRRKIQRPWLIIISAAAWLSAIPVAVILRLRGARLIPKSTSTSTTSNTQQQTH